MSNSLRDQLLGLGYTPAPKPERPVEKRPETTQGQARPARAENRSGRPDTRAARADNRSPRAGGPTRAGGNKPMHADGAARNAPKPARSREEMDLAKAYALRAQKEKDDRIEAERLKQEAAKSRREAKGRAAEILKDRSLNDPAADIARHFEYGGRIKRVHVTADQLRALNAGDLGVAQMDGRYLLVPAALLLEVEAVFPQAVALRIDPDAPAADDPYSDPAYQVPDDLVW